jgi:anti-anti-sigma factor
MSETFSVHIERSGPVHRLRPVGELDLATVGILERAFEEVFEDGDAEMIVIDLTELSFIDSTGINLLLRMNSVCEHADRLRVVNGSSAVQRLFDITGVRAVLPVINKDDDPLAPAS